MPAEVLRGAAQSAGPGGRDGAVPVRGGRPPGALDKMGQERHDRDTKRADLHQGAGRREDTRDRRRDAGGRRALQSHGGERFRADRGQRSSGSDKYVLCTPVNTSSHLAELLRVTFHLEEWSDCPEPLSNLDSPIYFERDFTP